MTNTFHCSASISHQPEVFGSGAVVDSLAAIPGKAKGEEKRQGEQKITTLRFYKMRLHVKAKIGVPKHTHLALHFYIPEMKI